mmetsp:Transcript_21790/g.52694  ORF Transcript_21790/g.52694 Transcript_21790/m.52694 type:complete len:272 (-) Transcript_21790:42-857(-)
MMMMVVWSLGGTLARRRGGRSLVVLDGVAALALGVLRRRGGTSGLGCVVTGGHGREGVGCGSFLCPPRFLSPLVVTVAERERVALGHALMVLGDTAIVGGSGCRRILLPSPIPHDVLAADLPHHAAAARGLLRQEANVLGSGPPGGGKVLPPDPGGVPRGQQRRRLPGAAKLGWVVRQGAPSRRVLGLLPLLHDLRRLDHLLEDGEGGGAARVARAGGAAGAGGFAIGSGGRGGRGGDAARATVGGDDAVGEAHLRRGGLGGHAALGILDR